MEYLSGGSAVHRHASVYINVYCMYVIYDRCMGVWSTSRWVGWCVTVCIGVCVCVGIGVGACVGMWFILHVVYHRCVSAYGVPSGGPAVFVPACKLI